MPTAYPTGLITLPTPFKTLPVVDNILSFSLPLSKALASVLTCFLKLRTCSVDNFSNFKAGFVLPLPPNF